LRKKPERKPTLDARSYLLGTDGRRERNAQADTDRSAQGDKETRWGEKKRGGEKVGGTGGGATTGLRKESRFQKKGGVSVSTEIKGSHVGKALRQSGWISSPRGRKWMRKTGLQEKVRKRREEPDCASKGCVGGKTYKQRGGYTDSRRKIGGSVHWE